MRTMRIILMALVFVHICCGGGGKSKQSYPDLVEAGWSAFADGDYNAAFSLYSDAIDADPEQAAAYAGLGWALMKLDNIAQANGTFNTGSTKTNPPADLFAGWSFVLNAQKSYANSN
ncbi:tetratricopeptide repeat protein, partial [Candidatus Saccharibacteria bacterium]|nr:tetratricopeptide repeat protein [Candidatus Saccharibacteria bacterium]